MYRTVRSLQLLLVSLVTMVYICITYLSESNVYLQSVEYKRSPNLMHHRSNDDLQDSQGEKFQTDLASFHYLAKRSPAISKTNTDTQGSSQSSNLTNMINSNHFSTSKKSSSSVDDHSQKDSDEPDERYWTVESTGLLIGIAAFLSAVMVALYCWFCSQFNNRYRLPQNLAMPNRFSESHDDQQNQENTPFVNQNRMDPRNEFAIADYNSTRASNYMEIDFRPGHANGSNRGGRTSNSKF